jgi:hypothetical protein
MLHRVRELYQVSHETLTVNEAIGELKKATGKEWTANNLLPVLFKFCGMVEAELPNTYAISNQRYDAHNNLVDKQNKTSATAKLSEDNLPDLLKTRETKAYFSKHDGETVYSTPPDEDENTFPPNSFPPIDETLKSTKDKSSKTNIVPISELDLDQLLDPSIEVFGEAEDRTKLPYFERNEFIAPVMVTMDMVRVPVKIIEQLKADNSMWATDLPDVKVEPVPTATSAPSSLEQAASATTAEAIQAGVTPPAEVGSAHSDEDNNQKVSPPLEGVASPNVPTAVADSEPDYDEILAALFDPVPVEALEKMFPTHPESLKDPSKGKWKNWAERAKRNGLENARQGWAMFNPYKAAVWFVNKGIDGWDLDRCYRRLANNLPARSIDSKYLLTGDLED